MGMDFGDGPDFDAIKEEREAASKKGKDAKVELTEDDCWEHMIFLHKYEPTDEDDGIREILRNTLTGRHRMKKKGRKYQLDPHHNSPEINEWVWDGEAYEV